MLNIILRSGFFFLVREWRERYPHALALLGELFGFVSSLAVYWYTARAFAGHADFAGGSYFTYVVIGEASLMLPLGIVSGLLRAAREAQAEGVLDAMLVLPWSGTRTLLLLGTPCVLREGTRALALLLALSALGLDARATQVLGWLVVQAAAVPAFAALGLATVGWFFKFGRGEAALGFLSTIATILAGAYFPVGLFPESVRHLAEALSPFNVLLEACRRIFAPGGEVLQTAALGRLVVWAVALFPLGCLALAASLRSVRRRGGFEVG